MANEVTELRRLSRTELETITIALTCITADKKLGWAASAMLEDDAKFVRDLFWAS